MEVQRIFLQGHRDAIFERVCCAYGKLSDSLDIPVDNTNLRKERQKRKQQKQSKWVGKAKDF